MTQAPPDRLDRLESSVERLVEVVTAMDKKLDVHIARTDEHLKALDANLAEFKAETATKFDNQREDIKGTDKRLWTLIAGVVLALFGLLAKMAFFPSGMS